MRTRRALSATGCACCWLASLGCEQFQAPPLVLAHVKPQASAPASASVQLIGEIAYQLHRVRQRFHPDLWAVPEFKRQPCVPQKSPFLQGDEPLTARVEKPSHVLVIRVVDSRMDQRQLLPLHLTQALTSREFDELEQHFEPSLSRVSEASEPQPHTEQGGLQALSRLRELEQRRYLGVYYVRRYSRPKLILKLGKLKREWLPGVLLTWFAVYDLRKQERLCFVKRLVRNDTRDASISWRRRVITGERFTRDLIERTIQGTREQLAPVAHEVQWPPSKRDRT
ncbi:hypothetical protein ACFL5O_07530 [Myxococcota bacterium]